MTAKELDQVSLLLSQRARELGSALDARTSSVDRAICEALGFDVNITGDALTIARLASAYRAVDPASPTIERDATRLAGLKTFRLPKLVRLRLLELGALPAPPKPRDDRPAIERIESAIEAELRKPYRQQRQQLIRKWLEELEALRDTHDIYATA